MKSTTTLQVAAHGTAWIAAFALVMAPSRAQSFNIDIGNAKTVPAASYGAASGQIGRWMNVAAGLPGIPIPLTDISGGSTAVTAVYTPGAALSFDNIQTRGNDEALLDDGQRFSVPHVWKFSGLAPGMYDVFVYAWAPDRPLNYVTRATVVGSHDTPQEVGGRDWNGLFVQGGQYARHHLSLASGAELELQLSLGPNMLGTINGIQIRHEALGTDASACSLESASSDRVASALFNHRVSAWWKRTS